MKKNGFILFSLIFLAAFFAVLIQAQETATISSEELDTLLEDNSPNTENTALVDAEQEFGDAQLEQTAGFTPDSSLYFIEDKILTNFRNNVENKEKKVAEISEMIQEGNIDAARKALSKYNEYASELEQEIDPESSHDARRSAIAIRNVLRELESQIPEDQRSEFIGNVLDQEESIVTAAEIAGKIKKLCEELSSLDPSTYASTCKTSENSPKWQRRLDKDLTQEQEKEARQFFEVMSSCFENPSECQCDQIKLESFADECSIIAPLAAKCESGDESACNEMDERGDPIDLLPDYLQDVMRDIEDKYSKSEFDNHAPKECREAGAGDRQSCMEIMFKLNAPEECIAALNSGEIDLSNEREAREQCEEIMFTSNAPEECIQAGLRDHKECGKFMFNKNAPQECIDAGLTGESQKDHKKCEDIMKSSMGKEGGEDRGRGERINFDCRKIQNTEERLACYDKAVNGAQEHFDNRGPVGGWPKPCEDAGATDRDSCEKIMKEFSNQQRDGEFRNRDFDDRDFNNRDPDSFNSGSNNFRQPPCSTPEECERFRQENPDFSPPQEFRPEEPDQGVNPSSETTSPPESTSEPSNSGSSESSSSESSGESSGGSITGNIIGNNRFMRYYFRF